VVLLKGGPDTSGRKRQEATRSRDSMRSDGDWATRILAWLINHCHLFLACCCSRQAPTPHPSADTDPQGTGGSGGKWERRKEGPQRESAREQRLFAPLRARTHRPPSPAAAALNARGGDLKLNAKQSKKSGGLGGPAPSGAVAEKRGSEVLEIPRKIHAGLWECRPDIRVSPHT